MTDRFDLIVAGGRVVTPNGMAEGDVGIRAGRVAALGDLSAARLRPSDWRPAGLPCCPG